MEIVVSGIRPTGEIHLGNYFGAIKNFVQLQAQAQCYFFIADYHSLTTHPNAAALHQNVKEVFATYLACGIDPTKSALYVQSELPQIPELYLIFNMLAYVGELERCTTYKEKVAKQQNNINAGLLTYPVLMAVDVVIHKATKVPVGKDQEQHLEMARDFVKRFNHTYQQDIFPEPQAFNFSQSLIKVPGLDGGGKMGKSEGVNNAIFLKDTPEVIRKKVMRAVTDSGPTQAFQEKPQSIQNLFDLMQLVSAPDTVSFFENAYSQCNIRYGDMKKQLAEDIIIFTTPFREKIIAILKDEELLKKTARQGAEKAQVSAQKTIEEVRKAVGLKSLT